jgi:hypothetical protein
MIMLQELRDYWLPLMLFSGIMLVAILLLAVVTAMPFLIEELPFSHPLLAMFAEDATVRRTSIAGAIGMVVTACVFFRPNGTMPARKASAKKPPADTMAGA